MSTQDAYKSPLATLRTNMNNLTVGILASYRKHCASSKTASGELVLPESLKLLPVYANSMARSPAFRRGIYADVYCGVVTINSSPFEAMIIIEHLYVYIYI